MDRRVISIVFFSIFFLTQIAFSAQILKKFKRPDDIYLALSGGFGQSQQAHENTGMSGLLRIGFGSLWHVNKWGLDKNLLLGAELGFQTGNQTRLATEIPVAGATNAVPLYLNTKTPVDALFVAKFLLDKPFFIEAKGGAVYLSAEVTGADISTQNTVLPELQVGIGMGLSRRSRLLIAYQRYFGNSIQITTLNKTEGISQLTGIPTWQACLFTIEVKV